MSNQEHSSAADLSAWIGREESRDDRLDLRIVQALAATFDHDPASVKPGDALPPLWHWVYFTPQARASEIGPDGHPKRGGFLPPVELPNRMWAGGRLRFLHCEHSLPRALSGAYLQIHKNPPVQINWGEYTL